MLITSKDNSRIKHLRKLLDKKTSINEGLFVIEGENLVEEAIKNNLLVELYILDGVENRFDFDHGYDIILIELGWPKGLWSTEWRWDPAPFLC